MAKWISYADEEGVTYFSTEHISSVGTYKPEQENTAKGTIICMNNGTSFLLKELNPVDVYNAIKSSKILPLL